MPHNPAMQPVQPRHQQSTSALPLRPQDELECRRCGVHCDKVVYPSACLDRSCPFVYAYEEFGHTYIGCMQKVFEVELLVRVDERAGTVEAGGGIDDLVAVDAAAAALELVLRAERERRRGLLVTW